MIALGILLLIVGIVVALLVRNDIGIALVVVGVLLAVIGLLVGGGGLNFHG